jgi:hypothetical protein
MPCDMDTQTPKQCLATIDKHASPRMVRRMFRSRSTEKPVARNTCKYNNAQMICAAWNAACLSCANVKAIHGAPVIDICQKMQLKACSPPRVAAAGRPPAYHMNKTLQHILQTWTRGTLLQIRNTGEARKAKLAQLTTISTTSANVPCCKQQSDMSVKGVGTRCTKKKCVCSDACCCPRAALSPLRLMAPATPMHAICGL